LNKKKQLLGGEKEKNTVWKQIWRDGGYAKKKICRLFATPYWRYHGTKGISQVEDRCCTPEMGGFLRPKRDLQPSFSTRFRQGVDSTQKEKGKGKKEIYMKKGRL